MKNAKTRSSLHNYEILNVIDIIRHIVSSPTQLAGSKIDTHTFTENRNSHF